VHELHLETTRKTELVDVTARVREVVEGERGSAVVLYVPHTTAGSSSRPTAGSRRVRRASKPVALRDRPLRRTMLSPPESGNPVTTAWERPFSR
jgi:hypothetical protein